MIKVEAKEVKYYTLIKDIKFTDGFVAKSGSILSLIASDDSWNNVQLEDNISKRMFLVHNSNIEFKHSKKERWSKDKIDQHNIDINQKWLENEQRSSTPTRTGVTKRKISKPKRSTEKIKTSSGSRTKRRPVKQLNKKAKKVKKITRAKKKK